MKRVLAKTFVALAALSGVASMRSAAADFTFSSCSFRRVKEASLPEDWRRHGYAVNDRQSDKQFITRHATGFTFKNTRFDDP